MSTYPPPARVLQSSISHAPSTHADTYIYSLIPVLDNSSPSLAVITSSDELLVLDRTTLRNQGNSLQGVPKGVTALVGVDEASGQILASCGRDGTIAIWDLRKGWSPVAGYEMEKRMPVTALASKKGGFDLAGGTEFVGQQAVMKIWDIRKSEPHWQCVESHNDDITDLQFHPSLPNRLLSGSTDGLVSLFDTTVQDEDDALIQVINHGSIHKAGFLSNDAIYALSHDEQFSIHPLNTIDEEAVEPQPIVMGDLREKVGCEYVIDILKSGEGNIVATGLHSHEPKLDLIPVGADPWSLHDHRKVSLAGAHGGEIVRTVYVDDQFQSIYTGGEDGQIKLWKIT